MLIGIDSGGTFTDFVADSRLRTDIGVPCYRREQTGVSLMAGPALVSDYGSTVLVRDQWKFRQAEAGNLILSNV
jgi:N-methylhydantoinase A/oxoprolinase/acetone carboxylase beta subunit